MGIGRLMGLTWRVELDGGDTCTVVSDQRDIARWEVQEFFHAERWTLRARFLAWSAMRRVGDYKKPFEVFNEKDCIEVSAPTVEDEQDGEGEERVDPGRPTSADTPSSTSRSRRASRSPTS